MSDGQQDEAAGRQKIVDHNDRLVRPLNPRVSRRYKRTPVIRRAAWRLIRQVRENAYLDAQVKMDSKEKADMRSHIERLMVHRSQYRNN